MPHRQRSARSSSAIPRDTTRTLTHASLGTRPGRAAPAMLGLLLLLAACGGGDGKSGETSGDTSSTTGPGQVTGQVASYDLAVGPPSRFILGIFNESRGPVGFGTVPMRFYFLGTDKPEGTPQPGPTASGTYLPLPGSPPPPADTSKTTYLPTDQRGVYAAQVAFDRPGIWGVDATVDLDGVKPVRIGFKVRPKREVPGPGEPAPPSQNLTVSTPGAAPATIDSRASDTAPVPDPELHQTTVAQALAEKRPVLLVISTPTYCVSVFCGPITDMIAGLAKDYGNRARFIHVEVWKDFQAKQLNDAANEWIARGEDTNEPWVFLIGTDGKIAARFDNVATKDELQSVLQPLPVMPA
jgi:hypothetical protein